MLIKYRNLFFLYLENDEKFMRFRKGNWTHLFVDRFDLQFVR